MHPPDSAVRFSVLQSRQQFGAAPRRRIVGVDNRSVDISPDVVERGPRTAGHGYQSGRHARVVSSGLHRFRKTKAEELIRTIASGDLNPWLGKTFQPKNNDERQGYNRVKIGWLWRTAHFDYESGPSRAGNFNAIQLNYARWDNAVVLSSLKDEIRQVAPGLWLGRAYLEIAGKSAFLFYFGLQRAA